MNQELTKKETPSAYTTNHLAYSGHFLNDFGQYDGCQSQTVSHYLTMYFLFNKTVNLTIGFCGPVSCSSTDALNNIDTIYQLFDKGMGLPLKDYAPKNATTFYDPRRGEEVDFVTVLVFILLIGVVSLSVMGTSMNAYFEIKDTARKSKKGGNKKPLLADKAPEKGSGSGDQSGDGKEVAKKEKKPGERNYKGFFKLLNCFDLRKNFNRLVTVKYTDNYDYNLELFNGLRVLFMMYVVYGHTYLFGTQYCGNPNDILLIAKGWYLLVIYAALYSVDAFFFMSGFFFAFIAIGKLKKMRANIKSYLSLCFHRLFRIWPSYAFAILFFYKILRFMGSGPIWFVMDDTVALCNEGKVFENLFFLDDFLVQSANYCYGWGWYLSNDF
mmetsp:Transcript_13459/g.11524  ORF Transcript_13459/g.11524 Transcript_13459/m.11524 type:complete len:383 (+) Transcript_13459:155-1303(+)